MEPERNTVAQKRNLLNTVFRLIGTEMEHERASSASQRNTATIVFRFYLAALQ